MNLHEFIVRESTVEYASASSFNALGFASLRGTEVDDASERTGPDAALLTKRLSAAVERLNPALPYDVVEQVVRTVQRPPHPTLIENNRWLHGLPLAVIEMKDPTDEAADLGTAMDQLGRYVDVAPDLFVANMMLVASDGLLTRVGTITSGRQWFMPRRPATGGEPTLEALIWGVFEPVALLDYLCSCVVFEEDERGNVAKKVAGYHQFRAVRETRAKVLAALKPPAGVNTTTEAAKGGVVWHTQGSGKSLTMLMLAGALIREPALANPTIVMVTDRNDLDDQLFGTFAGGRALLRQDPVQAESRVYLQELLDRASGGDGDSIRAL